MADIWNVITGAGGAAVIAGSAYLKARGAGEPFELQKFLQTIVVGAVAGGSLGFTGVVISAENVTAQMAAYSFLGGGVAIFIENIGKYFVRPKVPVVEKPTGPTVPTTGTRPGFSLPRDGSKIMDGLDGYWLRMATDPTRVNIPDNQNYQWVSPQGNTGVGDKDAMIYLVSHPDAAGWRQRHILPGS